MQAKPFGYWTHLSNQRKFFDELAIKWKINSPHDWKSVRVKSIIQEGGYFLYNQYKGNLVRGT